MLPSTGFLLTVLPVEVPFVELPKPVELTYSEGALDFSNEEHDPPFLIETITIGDFSGAIESGYSTDGAFGYRAVIRRAGVYGTILVDTLTLEIPTLIVSRETCPDVTDEVIEVDPVELIPTSIESCPAAMIPLDDDARYVPIVLEES